ncbi:MAG: alpha-glucosidase/alpha-galactosidase [Firmicutes bacterium]|nr:alpha-glucosidase/alpha-galactosidase [Bacillota bacterium]MDD4263415.1 alpha-glucosidase/alpha-galactosidase [Bacillota bacterium]MDD4694024.1 alpha-glucosidase/alpha-galactosidase [Bacillota bacterium]
MAKVALMGAGSVVFAKQLTWDILAHPELKDSIISLHDNEPDRLDTAEKVTRQLVEKMGGHARVEASLNRKQSLKDADYVIVMVQVGMFPSTKIDFEIPRKYGLKQTIADSYDVGGIFRFLRSYPFYKGLLDDMAEVCPDAYILNYTNPMAMNMLGIFKTAPEIKAVGLCHSVQGTAGMLAQMLDVPYEELDYKVAGLNHQAFYLHLKHKGVDLYPKLRQLVSDPEKVKDKENKYNWMTKWDAVRVELFKRLGYYITESSEHNAEYTQYFIQHEELIDKFHIPIDEYIRRCEIILKEYARIRGLVNEGKELEVHLSHEYAGSIIYALHTGKTFSFNGNVLNTGLITNLPQNICVEVPCLVDRNGVQPTYIGDLPIQCAALNRPLASSVELAVEAALTGKRDYVYQAVMMSPHSSSVLNLDQIWAMCDDLIEAHGDMLPKLS